MDDKDILADSITKALAYQENGGKLDLNDTKAGKSGEMKSIFQFTPDTWANYSHQVYGKPTPMNNDTETYVVKQKVLKWIDQGRNVSQIASMWNAGEDNPDAYKENWRGTNSHGVHYDTPTYAANVLKYAKQFYQEKAGQAGSSQNTPQPQVASAPAPQPQQNNSLMGKVIKSSGQSSQVAQL